MSVDVTKLVLPGVSVPEEMKDITFRLDGDDGEYNARIDDDGDFSHDSSYITRRHLKNLLAFLLWLKATYPNEFR